MKAVILAGGFGTRFSEETHIRPKPMIEIGGYPILWHIMKIYSSYGINEFVICLGYKSHAIKDYFLNYYSYSSDMIVDLKLNKASVVSSNAENWKIHLIDTGLNTMTGGRLKRVKEIIGKEDFCFTYGDGVGDIDISKLLNFHKSHDGLATMTGVQPAGKFGALDICKNNIVKSFKEKPVGDGSWVNGGFFVLNPKVIDYIEDDSTIWEAEPLEKLAKSGDLHIYKHDGFWQPMDTLRDKINLNDLWEKGTAIWKKW